MRPSCYAVFVIERVEHNELPSTGTPEPRETGVDVSLIVWMLALSPSERLAVLQGQVDSIWALRNARIAPKVS